MRKKAQSAKSGGLPFGRIVKCLETHLRENLDWSI